MGAYSPAPVVTDGDPSNASCAKSCEPTVRGLIADGTPYIGFLYAGLMIAPDGTPNVLEFNCRFGDPETQPIMMRLASDLTELCDAALDGRLDRSRRRMGSARRARRRAGRRRLSRTQCARAMRSTAWMPQRSCRARCSTPARSSTDGKVVTNGGRVLCAVGLGTTVSEAQRAAYALCEQIHWDGMQYRRDIGYRAIEREKRESRLKRDLRRFVGRASA